MVHIWSRYPLESRGNETRAFHRVAGGVQEMVPPLPPRDTQTLKSQTLCQVTVCLGYFLLIRVLKAVMTNRKVDNPTDFSNPEGPFSYRRVYGLFLCGFGLREIALRDFSTNDPSEAFLYKSLRGISPKISPRDFSTNPEVFLHKSLRSISLQIPPRYFSASPLRSLLLILVTWLMISSLGFRV